MVKKVIATKGLPGSGKTTWAKQYTDKNPSLKVVRINNDDLQMAIFGKMYVPHSSMPKFLHLLRQHIAESVEDYADVIIIDNTNLSEKAMTQAKNIAITLNALFEVKDFTYVDLETCLDQNSFRENPVPEEYIRRLSDQYNIGKE